MATQDAALTRVATAFAEDLARVGWDEQHIVSLFRNPRYKTPHHVWRIKGEKVVREIVKEAMDVWSPLLDRRP
jgi:hypothetical protein